MKKYLAIGAVVQVLVIVLRWISGKSRGIIGVYKSNPLFWIGLLIGIIFNIVTWPFAIICEIINIKNGI